MSKSDQAAQAVDRLIRNTERRLDRIYSEALKTALKNEKNAFEKLAKYDKNPLHLSPEKHLLQMQAYKQAALRETQIVDSISESLARAGIESANMIQYDMIDVYGINRDFVIFQVNKKINGIGTSFSMYDRNQIKDILLDKMPPFSKIAYSNLENKKRITKELGNQLAQSTILGESQQKLIKRIRDVTGYQVDRAKRIAQTERTRVQSQGRYDTAMQASELGVPMQKRWTARMQHTRDAHADADGQVVDLKEPFYVGKEDLEYPGDPSGSASNVVNCFCVMTTEVVSDSPALKALREKYETKRTEQLQREDFKKKNKNNWGDWRDYM